MSPVTTLDFYSGETSPKQQCHFWCSRNETFILNVPAISHDYRCAGSFRLISLCSLQAEK